MQQVKFETSMKNIPLGGNKEYVIACSLNPSVADDPSGATDCTTHGINPKLVILLVIQDQNIKIQATNIWLCEVLLSSPTVG